MTTTDTNTGAQNGDGFLCVITFSLKDGAEADFLAAARAAVPDMAALPGLRSYQLNRLQDGTYLESMIWDDEATSQAGTAATRSIASLGYKFGFIDGGVTSRSSTPLFAHDFTTTGQAQAGTGND